MLVVVGLVGGGGLEPRLSLCATEELDAVDAVDVVSCALVVVSSGFNALASDSILVATAPVTWALALRFVFLAPSSLEGVYAVSITH